MKKYSLLSCFLLNLMLISCSRENPIDKNALSLSGKFLYQASVYAEKQLGANNSHGGIDYGGCVEGVSKLSRKYCEKLYSNMIVFGKNQNGPYKDLSVDDLTDANAYYQVKAYYDNQVLVNAAVFSN